MTFTKSTAVKATTIKITAAAASGFLLAYAAPSFAQQGTTLAGPAQGSKSNGSASTRPSGAGVGANGAATAGAGGTAGAATGTGDSKSTASGGNAGGSAGRN